MRKYILRIVCAAVTFSVSIAAERCVAIFPPQALRNITTEVAAVAKSPSSSAIAACESAPELPSPLKTLVDKYFPGWTFPQVDDEDCQTIKQRGGPDAHPALIEGDFDGNGRMDYAVLIQHGAINDGRGIVANPDAYIVAFLNRHDGYRMRIVTREAGSCLQVMRRGETDYDYDGQREFAYRHDTIFSSMGMGGTSYLYENGKFRAIITSD